MADDGGNFLGAAKPDENKAPAIGGNPYHAHSVEEHSAIKMAEKDGVSSYSKDDIQLAVEDMMRQADSLANDKTANAGEGYTSQQIETLIRRGKEGIPNIDIVSKQIAQQSQEGNNVSQEEEERRKQKVEEQKQEFTKTAMGLIMQLSGAAVSLSGEERGPEQESQPQSMAVLGSVLGLNRDAARDKQIEQTERDAGALAGPLGSAFVAATQGVRHAVNGQDEKQNPLESPAAQKLAGKLRLTEPTKSEIRQVNDTIERNGGSQFAGSLPGVPTGITATVLPGISRPQERGAGRS